MTLDRIDQSEALRYMGYGNNRPDDKMQSILDECEQQLLKVINPKFVYKIFDIEHCENFVSVMSTTLSLKGRDICSHLKECSKCVLLAATISAGADRLIRLYEAQDMTKAVMTDCLASAAVEQVCNKVDSIVKSETEGLFQTWRFSPGYGDLPIEIQRDFLNVLDAQKRIGLNATENNILIPRKSVTAVIGLSEHEISRGRRGCACCNMREVCQYRKRGDHCGF